MGHNPETPPQLRNLQSRHPGDDGMTINCRITTTALAAITTEAEHSRDGRETGGILLGTDHAGDITISIAGTPGTNAHRTSHSFHRDLDHANQLAATAWNTDCSQWIGEWHTHPSGNLTPSELDLTSYLRHVCDIELRFDRFVAIIVGPSADRGLVMKTWIITRARAVAIPVTVVDRR